MPKSVIKHITFLGDSLSDRATLEHRKLLGFISMGGLSGLKNHSPLGRFTNGYVWVDHLAAALAEELEIKHYRPSLSSSQLAEDIIEHNAVDHALKAGFGLDDDKAITYQGADFIRTYCEGGLTSHDWSQTFVANPKNLGARWTVSTLAAKRKQMFKDDRSRNVSAQQKQNTLIIEWSGANDLFTVNEVPTNTEARFAVDARIKNIEECIAEGYGHFALVNLPDLSLTPYYQNMAGAKGKKLRKDVAKVSAYFNQYLKNKVDKLQAEHSEIKIEVIDVNAKFFREITKCTHFEKAKITKPYTESNDFKINPDHTSPAKGYAFWDSVHPTTEMHALLADEIRTTLSKHYRFEEPHETLRQQFIDAYDEQWQQDRAGCFGFFRRSRVFFEYSHWFGKGKEVATKDKTLTDFLEHALNYGGNRSKAVMIKLGWLTKTGQFNEHFAHYDHLKRAYDERRNALNSFMR